ncbi:Uncharacterized conserved protein YybS, DUF2232 family [Pelagirhabdus alkalitolerans]|uniref:Uncharacterized conserved protein YybS, DUF2232 family n=1 Tax=Pelagirhabdus alkalitolerans TaxID=1612202 RepID=A0A1G6LDI6_9BACI|nr:DUF2232 domain-containing protein [Pelagirhabdus alkalitolerans]SDC41253.1 Uncharacterized conserved protein YybS, DUF2232 family [Pelagirhabdus alkalitolerans]
MQPETAQKMKEGLIVSAIFVALLWLTLYIPTLELVTMFIIPIPISLFAKRHGYKASIALGLLILLTMLFFALYVFIVSLPLALLAILAGTLMGQSIRDGRHPYETWVQTAIGFTIGFLILLLIVEWTTDVSLATEYQLLIREALESSRQTLDSVGMEVANDEITQLEDQFMVLLDLIPSIILVISAFLAVVSQWLTYKILNKWWESNLYFPKFHTLQLPRLTIWLYFLVVLISLIDFSNQPTVDAIVFNVSTMLGAIFSLQGLSFIYFYMYKKNQPKIVPILITFFSLVFLPVGLYLTRIFGILDVGFMLRKRVK